SSCWTRKAGFSCARVPVGTTCSLPRSQGCSRRIRPGNAISLQTMKKSGFVVLLVVLLGGVAIARPHKPCPAKGSSADKDVQKLDRGKNRKSVPKRVKKGVTLDFILGPGKDSTRFSNHYAARI